MTEEQIYILNANPINLQYIPITIFKRWLDRDYSHLTKDYLEARKIPIMVKGVDFHEWLTSSIIHAFYYQKTFQISNQQNSMRMLIEFQLMISVNFSIQI